MAKKEVIATDEAKILDVLENGDVEVIATDEAKILDVLENGDVEVIATDEAKILKKGVKYIVTKKVALNLIAKGEAKQ